jgi:putative transposase
VQRGHNRQVVFVAREDFRRYLDDLRELKEQFNVCVHAYCLMTNHVHLLLTPQKDSVSGMARLMKALAGRATRYRNRLEGRSGTLWEGRYKSSPVQTDRHLLACCRYIELNPVRAGMTQKPAEYAWSSFRQRMGTDTEDWIDRDPSYMALADSETQRRRQYRRFVDESVPDGEWDFMRQALQRGQLTGNDRFVTEIEAITGRRVEHRGQGRPSRDDGEKHL